MILALDHRIFGNGNGMRSPMHDNRFYWLTDQSRIWPKDHGELYTYFPGFGCQLHSYQWIHPKAGERRKLAGQEFVVFSSRRRWVRVEVAWAMVRLPEEREDALAAIRGLEGALGKLP